jgi:hypothetical protein
MLKHMHMHMRTHAHTHTHAHTRTLLERPLASPTTDALQKICYLCIKYHLRILFQPVFISRNTECHKVSEMIAVY